MFKAVFTRLKPRCFLSFGRSFNVLCDARWDEPRKRTGEGKFQSLRPPLRPRFELLRPSRDSVSSVPMQPRSSAAVPSRAEPCHYFPLINRVCLCKRRFIWGLLGAAARHIPTCLRLWYSCKYSCNVTESHFDIFSFCLGISAATLRD